MKPTAATVDTASLFSVLIFGNLEAIIIIKVYLFLNHFSVLLQASEVSLEFVHYVVV